MTTLKQQLLAGLPLPEGASLHGLAGTAAVITYTILGAEVTPDGYLHKVLGQGQLGTADSLLYSVPAGSNAVVMAIILANTSGSAVIGVALGLNGSSATAANQIMSSTTIPANGAATFADGVLRVTDAAGNIYQAAAGQSLGGVASIVAASAGINTTETQVVGQSFPAGFFKAGTTLEIEAYGTITSTVDNVVTFNIRVGPVTLTGNIPATLAVHCGNSGTVTAAAFVLRARIVIRTVGASGTVYAYGTVISLGSGAAVSQALALATELFVPTSRAVDTTVANIAELDCVTAATTTTVTVQAASVSVIKA